MNRTVGIVMLCCLSLSGLGAGTLLWRVQQQATTLHGSVLLGGYSLSGVPLEELTLHLESIGDALASVPLAPIEAPRASASLREWGIELDPQRTAQAIQSAWSQVPLMIRLFGSPRVRFEPQWRVNQAQLQARLQAFRRLSRPPRDAQVRFQQGRVVLVPEQVGRRYVPAIAEQNLFHALHLHLTNPALAGQPIAFSLGLEPIPPRLTQESLRAITGVMASYTSRFPGYEVARNHNIRLAAQALDGRVLMPGERLSYNEAVGARTLKEGFKLAPVIINGEKRLGVGGGICQVSSTLYNAVLLGEVKVVRRVNHSIPVTYVPLGRDATVTDGGLDFVIENNYDHPIALSVELGRSTLTIRILGQSRAGRRVVLSTERTTLRSPTVKEVPDPNLPEGTRKVRQKGTAGVRVVLWRTVYQDGVLVKRERVATSVYRAQPQIVAVGTRKVRAPVPVVEPETPPAR
ncbi:MAG: VanW family protein [Fimbriimonadales bacterium]